MTYLTPINIEEYHIYDILYSCENDIVIISPWEQLYNYKLYQNGILKEFAKYENNVEGSGNHNYVYRCKTDSYEPEIELLINDKIKIKTKVNIYPTFENEIIMCTMVKNEDNYIRQWINYHLNLGIQRFIIYDNKESIHYKKDYKKQNMAWITHDDIRTNSTISELDVVLQDYISQGIVLLFKWPYKYVLEKSGVSGLSSQQCQSLYAFRNSKYIGFFDIDEYINPQGDDINIDVILDNRMKCDNINYNDIGGFSFLCKIFVNPNNKPCDNYNFLQIYDCHDFDPWPHRIKNFAVPKNVNCWCLHMMANGKKIVRIDKSVAYFNHYFYLNKNRGKDKTQLVDKSIKKLLSKFNLI